jgi:hypothetical protein
MSSDRQDYPPPITHPEHFMASKSRSRGRRRICSSPRTPSFRPHDPGGSGEGQLRSRRPSCSSRIARVILASPRSTFSWGSVLHRVPGCVKLGLMSTERIISADTIEPQDLWLKARQIYG